MSHCSSSLEFRPGSHSTFLLSQQIDVKWLGLGESEIKFKADKRARPKPGTDFPLRNCLIAPIDSRSLFTTIEKREMIQDGLISSRHSKKPSNREAIERLLRLSVKRLDKPATDQLRMRERSFEWKSQAKKNFSTGEVMHSRTSNCLGNSTDFRLLL